MKNNIKALLQICRIALDEKPDYSLFNEPADWERLFLQASKQGVSCLGWRALERLHEQGLGNCPKKIKLKWFSRQQQIEQATLKQLQVSAKFAEKLLPQKIVALKGVDYARYWPNPRWREFGDLDCYAADGETKSVDKRAVEIGCRVDDGDYKHSHIFYKGMMVENHHFFTSFAGSQEGRELELGLRELFFGEFAQIDETALLAPNPTFTAVFMVAHAQNHFFYEGIALRHILDWHFFLQKEAKHVNWKLFNDIIERTHLTAFTDLLTMFCQEFLGLEECEYSVQEHLPKSLLSRFAEDLIEEKLDENDRRWHIILARIWDRFLRMYRFRLLMKMPIYKAIWRTLAFSSVFNRHPELN